MSGKVKAVLAMVFIFALGVVAGAFWQSTCGPKSFFHRGFREHRLARLSKELSLTAEQQGKVREIMQKAHERAKQVNQEVGWDLDDIHRDAVLAIRGLLTPEQSAKFDLMHKRMHKRGHTPFEHMANDDPGPRHGPQENDR